MDDALSRGFRTSRHIELGYKKVDYNGECQTGFGLAQATMRQGSRCSTAKAFILPASTRSNLHISLGSQVLRVTALLLIFCKNVII